MSIGIVRGSRIFISPYGIEERDKHTIFSSLESLNYLIYYSREMNFYTSHLDLIAASRSIRINISLVTSNIGITGCFDENYLLNYTQSTKEDFLSRFNALYYQINEACLSVK